MALTNKIQRSLAAIVLGGALAGLGGCAGTGVEIDAPILEAAGINLTAKKADEDLPERSGIVIPPSTEELPKPGQRTASADGAEQNWPEDPDKMKKRKEEREAAEREEYCREGDWSDDAGISEFEKNMGREERCPSKVGKAISQAMGGGDATE